MKSLTVELNGVKATYNVEPRETIADFLRERCRLTATHLGCEHGACGACTPKRQVLHQGSYWRDGL